MSLFRVLKPRAFALALVVSFSAAHVAAQVAPSATSQDYARFLERLGFRDFSAEITQTLAKNPDLSSLQQRILRGNRERFEIVNSSRDLGSFVMGRVLDSSTSERAAALDRLVELTSRALTLQPLAIPDEFPNELENIQSDEAREAAKRKWLDGSLRDLLERSEREIVSDIVTTLYGEQQALRLESANDREFTDTLSFVEAKVRSYVQLMYSDPDIAQTKFLGRALAASLVRYARAGGDSTLENRLEKAAAEKGAILGNFVSDELTFIAKGQTAKTVKVGNADFIMEYSGGKPAWSISSAVVPGGLINRVKAFFHSLYGNLVLAPFILDEQSLLKKVERGERRTVREHIAYFLMQLPISRRGYSHTGLAQVNRDEASGISMTWARDLYPNGDLGGVRFVGIESFAHDGTYQRFGIAKYDAGKFLKWAQKQDKTRGYQPVVWAQRELQEGANGQPKAVARDQYVQIQSDISEEDFRKLVSHAPDEAPAFMDEISGRVIQQMDNFMVGPQAMGFSQGLNVEHFASCTQAIALAFLKGTNIDPQTTQDRWTIPVKVAKKMNADAAQSILSTEDRVIAPGGFAWQTSLVKEHTLIDYDLHGQTDRYLRRFQADRGEMSRAVSDHVRHRLSSGANGVNLDAINLVSRQYLGWSRGSDGLGNTEKTKLTILSEEPSRKFGTPIDARTETPFARQAADRAGVSKAEEAQMRGFLVNLGFKDYVADMKQNLANGNALGPLAEGQLKRNIKSYEIYNASRELAITIMARMQNRMDVADDQRDLVELTTRLLAIQPLTPPREYPPEIMRLTGEARTKALEEHLWNDRKDRMEEHTRKLVSDIADLVYGREVVQKALSVLAQNDPAAMKVKIELARIHSLVAVTMRSLYIDTQIGRTAFVGRALAALIARDAQQRQDKTILKNLNEQLMKRGLRLANYLGDRFVLYDEGKKSWLPRKMQNMTMLLIKNQTVETAFISRGAIPADIKLGRELGVVGNLAYAMFVQKIPENGSSFSMLQRSFDRLVQLPGWKMNDGYSHVGFARVLQDPATGVKMTWVVDNYPEPAADDSDTMSKTTSTGGMRLGGYEHYDDPSHYVRFLAADHDRMKYFEFAIKHLTENGYPKDGVIFPAIKQTFNDKGELLAPANPEQDDWKMEMNPAQFRELHKEIFGGEYVGKSGEELRSLVDRWYERVMRYSSDQLVSLMERGMYFQWIVPLGHYYHGGGYCSFSGELALRMAGLTLEEKPDHFIGIELAIAHAAEKSPAVKKALLAKVGPQLEDWIKMANLKPGIIAPNGLVAQSFHGEVTAFDHPNRKADERQRASRSPFLERDREMTALLEKLLPRTEDRFNSFATRKVLEVYRASLAETDMDYAAAANAVKGKKAKIIDLEAVLNKGGGKSAPTLAPVIPIAPAREVGPITCARAISG